MNITCPHCGLSGKVDQVKLKASSGKLRCPRCKETFTPEAVVYVDSKPVPESPFQTKTPRGVLRIVSDAVKHTPPPKDVPKRDDISPHKPSGDRSAVESDSELMNELGELGAMGEDKNLGVGGDLKSESPDSVGDEGAPSLHADALGPLEEAEVIGEGGELETSPDAAAEKTREKWWKNIGTGYIVFLILALVWGSVYFGWMYLVKPYMDERQFFTDSSALFEEYHKNHVYLDVGIPDAAFVVTVAEMAYPFTVYKETYTQVESSDPLYVSLMVTGRLFLAIKAHLERALTPDVYYGSEWGPGLPIRTKERYRTELTNGLLLCVKQMNENYHLSRSILDKGVDYRVVDFLRDSKRGVFISDLRTKNKEFLNTDTALSPLREAIEDIDALLKKLPK
jgi:predicted Zn finger-like uncharacterized protein